MSVTLDENGYISVIEYGNNRLVGLGAYGFRRISGCGLTTGSAPNQSGIVAFDNHDVTFCKTKLFLCLVQNQANQSGAYFSFSSSNVSSL